MCGLWGLEVFVGGTGILEVPCRVFVPDLLYEAGCAPCPGGGLCVRASGMKWAMEAFREAPVSHSGNCWITELKCVTYVYFVIDKTLQVTHIYLKNAKCVWSPVLRGVELAG